jgi:hypothetical protein
LLNLENGSGSRNNKGMAYSTTTITGRGSGSEGSEEEEAPTEEYLRIRQTVDYLSRGDRGL